jgi:selenocysteine-specific elongation factor
VRVRGIETAGRNVSTVGPGARVALNLAGVEHTDLSRGDAVVRPSQWLTPRVVDVAMARLPGEQIRRRGRFQVYVGSGEHRVWLRVLDEEGTFARLRLDEPIPLAPGDRLVLRDSGRKRTVAGGEVLDVEPLGRARDAAARLALPLGQRLVSSHPWLRLDHVPRLAGCSDEDAQALVDELVTTGNAARVAEWVVSPAVLDHVRAGSATRALAHHAAHALDGGVEVSAVARSLRVTPEQLRAALADAPDVIVERGLIRHASHQGSAAESPDATRLLAALDATPFAPPAPKDVGVDHAVVRALVRDGTLIDVDNVVFTAAALDQARTKVIDALRDRGTLTVADIRDLLGSTRKYVVPIAGWLDREGVTRRRGDDRVPGPRSGLRELL